MKKLKNLNMLLVVAGIMGSLSFINCNAMEKNSDFVENKDSVQQEELNKPCHMHECKLCGCGFDEMYNPDERTTLKELKEDKEREKEEDIDEKRNLVKQNEILKEEIGSSLERCIEFENLYNEVLNKKLKSLPNDQEKENINKEEDKKDIDFMSKNMNFMSEYKKNELRQKNEELNEKIEYFINESNDLKKDCEIIKKAINMLLENKKSDDSFELFINSFEKFYELENLLAKKVKQYDRLMLNMNSFDEDVKFIKNVNLGEISKKIEELKNEIAALDLENEDIDRRCIPLNKLLIYSKRIAKNRRLRNENNFLREENTRLKQEIENMKKFENNK